MEADSTLAHMSGIWTGTIIGTNNGEITIDITADSDGLSGVLHVNDTIHGSMFFNLKGEYSRRSVELRLTPIAPCYDEGCACRDVPLVQVAETILGPAVARGKLTKLFRIEGEWSSDIGSSGTFQATKQNAEDKTEHTAPNSTALVLLCRNTRNDADLAYSCIAKAAEKYDITPIRAVQPELSGEGGHNYESAVNMVEKARFLICDLTCLSGEVLYVLGYAQGAKKEVILAAKADAQLPPSLYGSGVTLYNEASELEGIVANRIADLMQTAF